MSRKRAKPLSRSRFKWPLAVFRADYRAIIRVNGLDAYFFVRFLRVMAITFTPIWIISWIVLLPTTSVGTIVGVNAGLDKFTFGNIAPSEQARYAAHIILVYIFTCALHLLFSALSSHSAQFGSSTKSRARCATLSSPANST